MEFNYYGSVNDSIQIIKFIIENTRLKVIPDIKYLNRKVIMYSEMNNDLVDLISNRYKFYLWSEDLYEVFPLEYGDYKGDTTFYIKPSPCLNITLPKYIENTESDKRRCICGILSHSKQVFNKSTGEIIPVQNSVIDEYKKVVKLIKTKLIKEKSKNLWIGKEAYGFFEKGELEVIYNGEWVSS